jgi:uncharacterized protein (DUF58 family)
MSAAVGWLLVVAAFAAGYVSYGWPGVALAFSVVVFWMLLQFNRAVRLMREAAARPVGWVDSAVMLQSKLHKGQTLAQLIKFTRSLGRKLGDEPDSFAWRDAAGDEVRVQLRGGRLEQWELVRADAAAGPQA